MPSSELSEFRRRRKNASTYRYQKEQRKAVKAQLVAERGGRCEACGYDTATAALEFHHRDAASKEFQVSRGSVSRGRLWAEAAKCDLLCANCHRSRHVSTPSADEAVVVDSRRRVKQRAVVLLGGRCAGCAGEFAARAFEFHHLDASTKDFSISADGIVRCWDKIEAELAKCVLVCANCHREVHAGLRSFDTGTRSLSEEPSEYRRDAA